ncbi:nose resistant to fluoxetine protein 6-like [Anopheles aquasalis]|uniref:nose resistant to fluoxetine protein 6-like n=1 Tax=Anopheles aquasalis TaxID=42839 RepID=UPI00215A2A45|nr:nose resistant to fluoxetine protein 6-like [Anopheles aquasalis]
MQSVSKWLLFCLWFVFEVQAEDAYRLPDIFMYDDWETCSNSSVYCYAKTLLRVDQFPVGVLVPDTESTDRIVYNHRRHVLELGVCISKCQDEISGLSEMERSALDHPAIPVNYTFHVPSHVFPTMAADARRYSSLVNVCINKRLRAEYNISGHTTLEYCRPPRSSPAPPFTFLENAFIAITFILVSVMLLATFIDTCSPNDKTPSDGWVMAFSIRQNWIRLLEQPRTDLQQELVHIGGLRVVLQHLLIVIHSVGMVMIAPTQNYDKMERSLHHYPLLAYITTNAVLVQIFFTIGGYLLSVNFLRDTRTLLIDGRYITKKLLNRLLRLLPVYWYFLLFSVSINVRFDTTVSGYRLFTVENAFCRQNGWSNLLFINNLAWPVEMCLLHTWYLAADFQLFLYALPVLVVVHRWPKSSGSVFMVAILFSLWMPAYITYIEKLHPVFPFKLSEAKLFLMYDPWIRKIHMPSYANTGSYLAGLIAGYLHDRVTNHKLQLCAFLLYRAADRWITPFMVVVLFSSGIWYSIDVPKPSLWVSLYSAVYRNVLGVFVAVCFLRSINAAKGLLRRILSLKLLTTLGKLTYSVYVLHDVAMRFVQRNEPTVSTISVRKVLSFVSLINMLAFVGGLLVFLLVEQPMIQLFKPSIDRLCPSRRKNKTD